MKMDKRMIGLSSLAFGVMLTSIAVYYFGLESGNKKKESSVGPMMASGLACLLLMGGGTLSYLGFKDRP